MYCTTFLESPELPAIETRPSRKRDGAKTISRADPPSVRTCRRRDTEELWSPSRR
jgi:hypothetical protein